MTAQTGKTTPVPAEARGDATCDPITLQIVRGALHSIQREMDALIERTAMSPFIREKKDYYAAIYDAQGQLVAGTAMPSSGDMLPAIVEHYPLSEMKDGDIFWYNDCYASHGAITHSPDQLFVMPAFEDGRIVAFLLTWAHFNDIGGMRPGSLSADCTEIYQEGTIVPPLRVVHEGKPNDEVLRMFFRNSRYPAMIQGDVRAVLASVRLGRLRIHELAHRVGAERMCDAFFQLIERMRAHARSEMRRLIPPGEYRFTESIDSDGHSAQPLKLRYRLEVSAERIVLDTTESDDQSIGPINFLMSPRAPQMVFGSYLHRHDALFLSNAGAYATLDEVRLRQGSVLQPRFPAPLGFRGVTLMRNVGACLGLLNVATKGNANASHSAYVIYYVRGNDAEGKAFLLSDGIGVGYGARPDSDGNDAIYLTGNENYPAEFLEAVYPLRVRRYAINPDTGGAGRWRGGCGVVRELEVLAPEAMVSMRIDSVVFPPWGTNGGQCAGSGRCVVNPGRDDERVLAPMSDRNIVRRGDVLRVETGGGGGWGHPYDREAERVLQDVLNGFVSRERARTAYGVVLSEDGHALDSEATLELREKRPATELFHRTHYQEALA